MSFDTATLTWTHSEDEGGLFGYTVTLTDGAGKTTSYFVQDRNNTMTLTGLSEVTSYTVTVEATDNNGNRSGASAPVSFTTSVDRNPPVLRSATFGEGDIVILRFNTAMDQQRAENPAYYLLSHGATVKSAALSADGMTVTLTCEGIDASRAYAVGVIGLTDCKYEKNSIGFASATLERDLYLSVDFETDDYGNTYAEGAVQGRLDKISTTRSFMDKGESGMALNAGAGMGLAGVDFTLGEGTSITMWINGKPTSGYNILLAKGPKTTGHFEFYTRDGELCLYAPDLGDFSLGTNLNSLRRGWHQLAFVWENNRITVYLNGKDVGGCTVRGKVVETTDIMSFGSMTDGSMAFGGAIDTVRIYKRALTADELTTGSKSEGGIKTQTTLITLLPGETAPLGITAVGDTVIHLTTFGDAASLKDGVLTAERAGETLVYAVSEDGAYISGVVVRVTDSATEDDTDVTTDSDADPGESQPDAATDPAPSETEPSGKTGCGSTIGLSVTLVLSLCGGWLALAKKKND